MLVHLFGERRVTLFIFVPTALPRWGNQGLGIVEGLSRPGTLLHAHSHALYLSPFCRGENQDSER